MSAAGTRALAEPIRILSDIHLGHPATLVRSPECLTPFFEGVKTLIFNGDTVELRFGGDQGSGLQCAAELRELGARKGVEVLFINGNHDPTLTSLNHLDLCDGAILVTHGDMLFHDISPWSPRAGTYAAAHTRELEQLADEAFHDFEQRLAAGKRATLAVGVYKPKASRGLVGRALTFLSECWPPWRPLQILRVWADTPAKAEALARVFRPRARFILIGHLHFNGMFRRGPRWVINTGSFLPFSGRFVVDVAAGKLAVRRVRRRGDLFEPGSLAAQFDAVRLKAHDGF